LGIVSNSEVGKINTIDQVFNGIGYIGSTVWVDKGVKGLIPNGRNEDGTLNNIEFVTDNLLSYNEFNNNTASYASINYDNGKLNLVRNMMSAASYNSTYNYIYRKDGLFPNSIMVANVTASSSGIISFQPKQAFRAVDYNEASGIGMPSNRYIDLQLGATGTTYTAPANGYAMLRAHAKASNSTLQMYGVQSNYSDCRIVNASGRELTVSVPLRKGQTFKVYYDSLNTTDSWFLFRFIYAEGAQR
jgi:hypothetical protein